jgi:hypothetical protein
VGRPVFDWRQSREPQVRVVIGPGGVATGTVGGVLTPSLFTSHQRAEDFGWLVRSYAPFRARTTTGELIFRGRGRTRPGPVESRMIFTWVRRVAAEAVTGESEVPYGLALAWHRGVAVGSCEDLEVHLCGEVRASSCAWDGPVRGRLQPEALARVYGWFDRLAPFQTSGEAAEAGQPVASRIVFASRGKVAAGAADQGAIESFAAALFQELSARKRGAAPPPPAPVPGATPAAAPTPIPAPEPGQRLLLPIESPRATPPVAVPPGLQPPPPPAAPKGLQGQQGPQGQPGIPAATPPP